VLNRRRPVLLLRPGGNAQIADENRDAAPNEAAFPFIDADLRDDFGVFPSKADICAAEIVLRLSAAGQKLYNQIWERFAQAAPELGGAADA
jgi:hypothetical protein